MPYKNIGFVFLSALLLSVSVLIPPLHFLIWVAFVPLLIFVSKSNLLESFLYGSFCGDFFFASLLYWLIQYEFRILVIVLVLTAPFFGLFSLLTRWLWNHYQNEIIRILIVPIAWFLIHFIYSFTPIDIIGNQIAFLQAPNFPGIVKLTGLSGITFLVLLVNALIAHVILSPSSVILSAAKNLRLRVNSAKDPKRDSSPDRPSGTEKLSGRPPLGQPAAFGLRMTLCGLVVAMLIYGTSSKFQFDQTQPLRVALVQHNFHIDPEWRARSQEKIMNTYQQTIKELGGKTDLIAFPQYGLPVDVLRKPEIFNQLAKIYNTSIILGTYIPKTPGGDLESGERTDSALVFPPNRPVEEYQAVTAPPFRQIGQVLGTNRKTVNIIKHTPSPFPLPLLGGEGKGEGVKAGVMLCYEDVRSEEGRSWARNGAQILVALSNPGHFLGTHLPLYHLTHDRIRAIETGKYLIRVSPNGFSAIINPNGELIKISRLNEAVVLNGVIYPNDQKTGFVKWGDFLPKVCVIFGIVFLLNPLLKLKYNRLTLFKLGG